jgi:23S rRNA (cytosine1962-C5)-methyltransferase
MTANRQTSPNIELLSAAGWKDYELLDSGNGLKLERFGPYTFIRPEHQAIWHPALNAEVWNDAHAEFIATGGESGGRWSIRKPIPESWPVEYHGLRFFARTGNSRHLGFFPEQAAHWNWIVKRINQTHRVVSVLNLFGYTGVATLAAARAGAKITHVDASKKTVNQARENQILSQMDAAPIRWIVDDAMKFVRREARRGMHYDAIILDPPKFGRGPKGEVWEFFDMLPILLMEMKPLIGENPLFILLTAYAIRVSALSLFYTLEEMMSRYQGQVSVGELVLQERSASRQISMAIYGRWSTLDIPG